MANALSCLGQDPTQVNAIMPTIDYTAMAKVHPGDNDFQDLQLADSNIKFARVVLPMCTDTLLCDISTGKPRPFVPEQFRHSV